MKSLLILVLALAINTNVMAQDPAAAPVAPTPVEGTAVPAATEDKALVDQNHKADSTSLDKHADKKKHKKNKKNKKGKKHGAKKHKKNKKSQA